jgi:DNA-binding MarR family transcriptional regulator
MPTPEAPATQAPAAQGLLPAALTERLGFLLKHAYAGYQTIQRSALEPLSLDGRRLAVLTLVDAEGPALQQRLAERLGVDRTTMVALVDALEAPGLVRRRRDPADRRGQQVTITRRGVALLQRANQAVDAVEETFLAGLSELDQRQLRRLLGRVVAGAGGH